MDTSRAPAVRTTSRDDLVAASKAIYDEMKSGLDRRLQSVKAEVIMEVGKALEQQVDEKMAGVRSQLASLEKAFEMGLQQVKDILGSLPDVKVQVLPPRPMRKTIEYSSNGFPVQITETEVKE